MSQFISQVGIDWHLLLSQAVNFLLLLVVLRLFVYKPLLKLMRERRAKIEEGIMKAEEASRRLREAEEAKKEKIKEGESEALALLKKTESDAKALETALLGAAKDKEAEELAAAAGRLKAAEEESRRRAEKEAAALVRAAIVKTVELAPEQIDDALISRAVAEAVKHR